MAYDPADDPRQHHGGVFVAAAATDARSRRARPSTLSGRGGSIEEGLGGPGPSKHATFRAQPNQSCTRRPAGADATLAARKNANTVSVISGTPGGTYFRMASELAFVLDDGDNLRVLPILGKGAGENAYDLRYLKGVDLGFVRTDTLDQLRQDKRVQDIEHRTFTRNTERMAARADDGSPLPTCR